MVVGGEVVSGGALVVLQSANSHQARTKLSHGRDDDVRPPAASCTVQTIRLLLSDLPLATTY